MMLRGIVSFTICVVISVSANGCSGAVDWQPVEIGAHALGNVDIANEAVNGRNNMLENAGRFIDPHTMVWMRKLDVPVARVWEAVSTKQGLEEWWIVRSVEIDLRPGGAFSHHWENTITTYKENEYIDFGGMRFELKADGGTTVFSFIDRWAEDAAPRKTQLPEEENAIDAHQPGGPGTPWSGVCAGWHGMIDTLETYLTGKTFSNSWEETCRFYADYLTDHFRWQKLMAPKQESPTMIGIKQDVASDSGSNSSEMSNMTRIRQVKKKTMSDIGKLFIALKVKDVGTSVEFYKKLGFLPEDEANWNKGYARFSYQGTSIALMDFIPQEVLLLNLEQKDQTSVDALGERLKGEGIPVGPAGPPGSDNKGLYLEDRDGNGFFIFTNAK